MRTALLTIVAALFATTASIAQTKTPKTPTTTPVATATATDPTIEQKRAVSGDLKNSLGTIESLIKRAADLAGSTSGPEQEGHMATANQLKTVKVGLMEQLDLVNQASPEQSTAAVAKAREVLASSNTTIDSLKDKLMEASGKPLMEK